MFKTILQTVNQMHKLGVIHLGTDLILELQVKADFRTKRSVWNSAERAIFRGGFNVLVLYVGFQMESRVTYCYLLLYYHSKITGPRLVWLILYESWLMTMCSVWNSTFASSVKFWTACFSLKVCFDLYSLGSRSRKRFETAKYFAIRRTKS